MCTSLSFPPYGGKGLVLNEKGSPSFPVLHISARICLFLFADQIYQFAIHWTTSFPVSFHELNLSTKLFIFENILNLVNIQTSKVFFRQNENRCQRDHSRFFTVLLFEFNETWSRFWSILSCSYRSIFKWLTVQSEGWIKCNPCPDKNVSTALIKPIIMRGNTVNPGKEINYEENLSSS